MATALVGSQSFGRGQWPGHRSAEEVGRNASRRAFGKRLIPYRPASGDSLFRRPPRPRISPDERERLLMAHLPQVRSIASRLRRRLPPQAGEEDLFHAGVVGLIEAVDRYDPRKGAPFAAFADFRIRGAIFDCLREIDWGPRRLRRCGRQLGAVKESLRKELGRSPDEFESAWAMRLGVEEYRRLIAELRGLRLETLDEEAAGEPRRFSEPHAQGCDPFELCLRAGIGAIVAESAAGLDERERRVLALYYDEELKMKEVAGALGVGESRVCQLHVAALGKVRARLGERNSRRQAR
ncbi:MAG TPA: FliA/WhiG family RNA polymerase sigma factor [Candidatus Dormibacteraeota bacterium]|nr:FliA/WhiG family RNA polymerase sigma factor [Candidatus Dormibacteraeota bacterium]